MQAIVSQAVRAKLAQMRGDQHDVIAKNEVWTQGRLAREMGIDASTLSLKLNGARSFSLGEAKLLADFLGFDLNSFYALVSLDSES